jgi:tetratricopeptide (TPR) repeat protein
MSSNDIRTCPACGARLDKDADTCDLCGTPVTATDLPQVDEPIRDRASADEAADQPPEEDRGVYCNACGWENPLGARYCSQCGEALQHVEAPRSKPVDADLPRHPAETATPEPSDVEEASADEADDSALMTWHVGLVVGVALLAVVGLFLANTLSRQVDWGGETQATATPMATSEGASAGQAGAASSSAGGETNLVGLVRQTATDSIPPQLRDRIETLQSEINERSGVERRAKQQELVNLYVGAGQLGQAAVIQRRIAEASGQAEAWRRTGDLLYSWMETLDGQQPASSQIAESVVEAYQNVLDQEPDNLDVRTDMATAYLQTNQPMRGVQEINRVLEEDPNHFQARFNKGIMLTMIGRAEEAIQQFEQVKEIVGSDSPYYQQANQAIETIRSRMDSEGTSSG